MRPVIASVISALLLAAATATWGHSIDQHTADGEGAGAALQPESLAIEEKARAYFTDLPLRTQDGTEVRFFTDLLKNHVVLINLFYTKCTAACPLTTNQMALVQDRIADQLGKRILLISLTLDPVTDTPEVLKNYAAGFSAKPGWYFLTGSPADIRLITGRLGKVGEDIAAHNALFLLGDVDRARWVKVQPSIAPEVVAEKLRGLAGLGS